MSVLFEVLVDAAAVLCRAYSSSPLGLAGGLLLSRMHARPREKIVSYDSILFSKQNSYDSDLLCRLYGTILIEEMLGSTSFFFFVAGQYWARQWLVGYWMYL